MNQSRRSDEQRMELESTGSSLETARIGGHRSAIIAALAVVGVLVAVVWVGVSGRPTPAPLATFNPVADLDPTPGSAAAPTVNPTGDLVPDPTPGAVAAVPRDIFGVFANLGDVQFATILAEPEPGHLVGRLSVPIPPPASDGTFAFQQFSSEDGRGLTIPIADWPINVDALAADSPEFIAVNAELPARRTIVGAPRPVEHGYRLTVVGRRNGSTGEFTISIRIGPNRQLDGNDGILGWPVVNQPPTSDVEPSEGDASGYCGPEAAPPAPGPDETDC
jgi:hypothetical protein